MWTNKYNSDPKQPKIFPIAYNPKIALRISGKTWKSFQDAYTSYKNKRTVLSFLIDCSLHAVRDIKQGRWRFAK